MPRTPLRRVAEGIYRGSKTSLTAVVTVGTWPDVARFEQPFDLDTPLSEIQAWRDEKRVEMRKERPNVARGSLAADVPTYLKGQAHKVSYAAKKSELAAWVAALGDRRRHQIRGKHLSAVISTWLEAEVSKKTILNRCRTLHHLYVTLADDKKVRTPLDNIEIPRPDKTRPKHVANTLIARTEKRLRARLDADSAAAERHQATKGQSKGAEALRKFAAAQANLQRRVLDSARARARFMVLASTGIRPSQLRRLQKPHVDLRRRIVDIAGGKGGDPILQAMNGEMLVAWRAFVDARAWGSYDDSKFRRRLKAAGWPAGLRVYNTKHAVGFALAEGGADHEDIKDWMGHTDTKTTRLYTGVSIKRIRRMSATLDGRFGWAALAPFSDPFSARTTTHNLTESRPKTTIAKSRRAKAENPPRGKKTA